VSYFCAYVMGEVIFTTEKGANMSLSAGAKVRVTVLCLILTPGINQCKCRVAVEVWILLTLPRHPLLNEKRVEISKVKEDRDINFL
jgi:hypothetical protein